MLGKVILLDASVLYSAPLRDLLMRVAVAGLMRLKWSDAIQEEWINALLRQRPDLSRTRLERTRGFMDRAVPDARVQDYATEEAALAGKLPDPGDAHVVAAAIAAEAEVIVTFNLKHFPPGPLAARGLRALHPDPFLCALLEAAPKQMAEAMREHRLSMISPPKTVQDYLDTLVAQKLSSFVESIIISGITI